MIMESPGSTRGGAIQPVEPASDQDRVDRALAGLIVGVALDVLAMLGCIGIFASVGQGKSDTLYVGAAMGGGLCLMMLLVALITKPDGRAETADKIINRRL